jgi:hypothetical protein
VVILYISLYFYIPGIYSNKDVSTSDYFNGHTGRAPGYRSIVWYQPDRQMTISVITNYPRSDTRLGGLSPYEITRVLYAALPNFIVGNENRKEAKIILCWNGREMMDTRPAAEGFIKKVAYLVRCETMQLIVPNKVAKTESELTVYPNPAYTKTQGAGSCIFIGATFFLPVLWM